MKVGDLVTQSHAGSNTGIIIAIDPEEIGDSKEVLVFWDDGEVWNHSVRFLEVISESR